MKKLIFALILSLSSIARGDYLGSWKLNDYVTFTATTHRFSTGDAYAASPITYSIYEDASDVPLVDSAAMTAFDSITGLYIGGQQLTAELGFEKGKHYTAVIKATVDSVSTVFTHNFQIRAEVNDDTVSVHTWHVATTGNNANDGHSFQTAKRYIATDAGGNSAVTAAASGDTIIIWPGDYTETVDFTSTGASLTMIGMSRTKSRIIPATGNGIILTSGSVIRNLSVQAIGANTDVGVSASSLRDLIIDNCVIYGDFAGLGASSSSNIFLKDSVFSGKYDAVNFSSSATTGVIADNCIFNSLGTHGTGTNSRALISGGTGIYKKCIFYSTRNDVSTYALVSVVSNAGYNVYDDCVMEAVGGTNHTGVVYGFKGEGGSYSVLNGCSIKATSTSGRAVYDIAKSSTTPTAQIVQIGTSYDTTNAEIKHGGSCGCGDINGDCKVDFKDLAYVASHWLEER
jgi:hypothetical protein